MIIFEDDHYRIHTNEGDDASEYIVASLTCFAADERGNNTYFAAPVAQKLNLPWVGIVALHDAWYLDGNYEYVISITHDWIVNRKSHMTKADAVSVVGYGLSMGAYGAVKHSRALGTDNTIAMAPQWTIDRSATEHDSRFNWAYQPFMKEMGVRRSEATGEILLMFDPSEAEDVAECALYQKHVDRVTPIRVLRGTHTLPHVLKGTQAFKGMLENVKDPEAFRRAVKNIRRSSLHNLISLFSYFETHRPYFAYKLLKSRHFEKIEVIQHFLQHDPDRMWRLATRLCRYGHQAASRSLFHLIYNDHRPVIQVDAFLMGWTGELLTYDHVTNTFFMTSKHFVRSGSPITFEDGQLLAATPRGLSKIDGAVHLAEHGIYIQIGEKYLSCRPEGTVEFAEQRLEWERFDFFSDATEEHRTSRNISANTNTVEISAQHSG